MLGNDMEARNRLKINITGKVYEVQRNTLLNFPKSRLAMLTELSDSYDTERNEFYFDRDQTVFESVLNYYRTKELHVPLSLCGPVVKKELEFWGVDDTKVERCCWPYFTSFQNQKLSLLAYEKSMVQDTTPDEQDDGDSSKLEKWKESAWLFLDNPKSSKAAAVYAIVSLFVIAVSIVVLIMSTMACFKSPLSKEDWAEYHGVSVQDIYDDDPDYWSTDNDDRHRSTPSSSLLTTDSDYQENITRRRRRFHLDRDLRRTPEIFQYLNLACAIFFSIELLARFCVCPSKGKFVLDVFNIIDLLAIIPMYVWYITHEMIPKERFKDSYLDFINGLQVIRIFRILRLMKYSRGLWVLVYTVKVSLSEIALTFVFVGMGVLIFGSMMHYADERKTFEDIPSGFWWAIVTMTTVGYGDKYPKTPAGYILGSICSISGVIVIALTVPIVVNNFLLFYQHAKSLGGQCSNETESKQNVESLDNDKKLRDLAKNEVVELNDGPDHNIVDVKPVSTNNKNV